MYKIGKGKKEKSNNKKKDNNSFSKNKNAKISDYIFFLKKHSQNVPYFFNIELLFIMDVFQI